MKKTSASVNNMRTYFKKNRADSFPITDHPLEKADEHIKSLYITMLCVIMNNDDSLYEERRFFVQRLIKGIGLNENIDYYDKKALEIDDKFTEEFVKQLIDNDLKYNFLVDSLILISSRGTPAKKDLDFVCEVYDVLALSKENIEFGCDFSVCCLEQKGGKFSRNYNLSVEKIERFYYLYKEFFNGKLIDTEEIKYFYSNSKKNMFEICNIDNIATEIKENENIALQFTNEIVIFENLDIDLSNIKFTFSNCDKVIFKNCKLSGQYVKLKDCNEVLIENCKFEKFYNRAIYAERVNKLTFISNEFIQCSLSVGDIGANGGVIYLKNIDYLKIECCIYKNCFINTSHFYNLRDGIVVYGEYVNNLIIKMNKFISCKSMYSNVQDNNLKSRIISARGMNGSQIEEENELDGCGKLVELI